MYFNVSQLLKETSGSTRHYEIDEDLHPHSAAPIHHVAGTINFLRTDKGVWVSAELESSVSCECSRCLEACEQPVRLSIEEEFFPVIDVHSGLRLDLSGAPEDAFYIDQNHILDITEALRQYSEMSIPMKPVCREDCAGICVNCGVNLNESQCVCEAAPRDHRWGPLLEYVSAEDNYN